MSKAKGKNNKNRQTNGVSLETITPKPEAEFNEDFVKTFDVREKRIGIVFKIIYVFAIALGTVFMDYVKRYELGLDVVYIAESCLMSFLLVMVVSLIVYIINEMKCMRVSTKITGREIKKQNDKTEIYYSNIFSCFMLSGITAIVVMLLLWFTYRYLNAFIMVFLVAVLTSFCASFFISVSLAKKPGTYEFLIKLMSVAITITIISYLILLAMSLPNAA